MRTPDHIRQKKYRENNRYKNKIRLFIRGARSLGVLIVGECAYLNLGGCEGIIQAAHHDWKRPLDFRWICKKHHYLVDYGKLLYPYNAPKPIWILGSDFIFDGNLNDPKDDSQMDFYGL